MKRLRRFCGFPATCPLDFISVNMLDLKTQQLLYCEEIQSQEF